MKMVLILLLSANLAYALDYCGGTTQELTAYVTYANSTPALNASVDVRLWDGNITHLSNAGNGHYNYTLIIPAYSAIGSNSYGLFYNSSNPTASATDNFNVLDCAEDSNIPLTAAELIIVGIFILLWLAFFIMAVIFGSMHLAILSLVFGAISGLLITRLSIIGGLAVILASFTIVLATARE